MWYRIPAYEALWPLLDAINAEMDAKMEQVAPTYPGIIGSGCAKCSSFLSDLDAVTTENESLHAQCVQIRDERDDKAQQLDAIHEQNAVLQQLIDQQAETIRTLKEQRDCNEHLRMDRGIYSERGFNTAGE